MIQRLEEILKDFGNKIISSSEYEYIISLEIEQADARDILVYLKNKKYNLFHS